MTQALTADRDHTAERPGTSQDGPMGAAAVGRNELGRIDLSDRVAEKIAARAAVEHPDAGAATTRVLGVGVPGSGSDLDRLPKTSVEVDGSKAYVRLELAIRWPASVAATTAAVRDHVRHRVHELTGLDVEEVHITVADMVTDITPPPRVH